MFRRISLSIDDGETSIAVCDEVESLKELQMLTEGLWLRSKSLQRRKELVHQREEAGRQETEGQEGQDA